MKEFFNQKHIDDELNVVYIEDEDVLLACESIEGSGKNYVVRGAAKIDGEIYHDFEVEFQLLETPSAETIDCVMKMEWDWYDFVQI